jgi:steroid 5-alpha reductase family enzyme
MASSAGTGTGTVGSQPVPKARSHALLICTVAYIVAVGAALVSGFAMRHQHPIVIVGIADTVATIVVFGFSRLSNNSSIYDPYWSAAPLLILPYFALGPWAAEANSWRLLAVFVVVFMWGIRLTYNWARRWKGLHDEDFRYVELRKKHGQRYWLVSFFGIHYFPTVLVFLGCLPLYYACKSPAPFGALDAFGITLALIAIWFEATADEQLRVFAQGPREPGAILKTGLWRYSRHPNYFGEIPFWWALLAFGVAASPSAWWTAAGALAITALFNLASVPLIDTRMLEKRPHYADHMKSTNAIFPWWPKGDG